MRKSRHATYDQATAQNKKRRFAGGGSAITNALEKAGKKKGPPKPLIAIIVVLVIAAIAVGSWFFYFKDFFASSNLPAAYVSSVASITGADMGLSPKYSGIVESQKTVDINKDESQTVSTIYVSLGDEIEVGTKLFSYDTDLLASSLEQAEIDLDRLENNIVALENQITDLKKQRDAASNDEKPHYTILIGSAELSIKEEQYNIALKQAEIEKIKKSMENSDVLSETAGIIKSLNPNGGTDNMGNMLPFISILLKGDYRIKGTVSELNIHQLYIGQEVTIKSRIDDSTWNGVIESVDMDNAVSDNNNNYYYDSGNAEKASKYNFYVTLDNLDGLMLGQHVYIEPKIDESEAKTGVWLPSFYIEFEGDDAYAWVRGNGDKLDRVKLTLGEYDENEDTYEIVSGVGAKDYIAFPDGTLVEGQSTTTDEFAGGDMSGGSDGGGIAPADNMVTTMEG